MQQLDDCADALGITLDSDWNYVFSPETKVSIIIDHLNYLLEVEEEEEAQDGA